MAGTRPDARRFPLSLTVKCTFRKLEFERNGLRPREAVKPYIRDAPTV